MGIPLAWYENMDGMGTFSDVNIISTSQEVVTSVVSADFDNDGDNDLVAISVGDDLLSWYENMDGQGFFGSE